MLEKLNNLQRTHICGELHAGDVGKEVVLMGWVHRRRDLGRVIFLDLRDHSGLTQVVFNKEANLELHRKADRTRPEFVVAVEGKVVKREKANPKLPTGEVEVVASNLHILNTAQTIPIPITDQLKASEETRLRFRFLDLRRAPMQRNLRLRHRVVLALRHYFDQEGFCEIETPFLTRSTPEGARDYLVPSRVHPGQFYALPQSPQIFKQLLMISGFDRYFQVVRCFRDEDLRTDRQPEFTQLDLEMAFTTPDAVFRVVEGALTKACAAADISVTPPFPRLTYQEALARYGTDKPDTRFGMELVDVSAVFEPARETLQISLPVHALVAPGAASFSRKQLDELSEFVKSQGAPTLYAAKVKEQGIESPLKKALGETGLNRLLDLIGGGDQSRLRVVFPSDEYNAPQGAVAGMARRVVEHVGLEFQRPSRPLRRYAVRENVDLGEQRFRCACKRRHENYGRTHHVGEYLRDLRIRSLRMNEQNSFSFAVPAHGRHDRRICRHHHLHHLFHGFHRAFHVALLPVHVLSERHPCDQSGSKDESRQSFR